MNKPNHTNRTIFTGDNLDILRGLDSESVDLIYLDPPFNSNRHYSAPIGSEAAGAEFRDAWTFEDTDDTWWGELADNHESLYRVIDAAGSVGGKGDKAYLIYMAMRLLELHRVLKSTGSLYLHCDPTMSHSLKMALDAIFYKKNFRNEIIWCYTGPRKSPGTFSKKHDVIFFYSKTDKYFFNTPRIPHKNGVHNTGQVFGSHKDKDESKKQNMELKGKLLEDWWVDIWSTDRYRKELTGYPTQKPKVLLDRIIKASCPVDGMVLDPFCGCATTCIASEYSSRQWIGIDISPKAAELVRLRGEKEIGLAFPITHRTDIPTRDCPPRSKNIKHTLFGKQEGMCRGCKVQFPYSNFTIDHVIPVAKGGADTNGNLQLLCNYCNSVKGDRPMEYLLTQLKKK